MKRKIMCAFVATSMAFSTVVSPMPIYGVGQVQAFAAEAREGETILDSGTMQVRIDNNFPRVIDYTLGNKVFYGQPNAIDTVEVNGYDKANSKWSSPKSIKVSGVTITKDGDKSATYTVPVKDGNIDSIVTVKITVENNTLSYDITDIKDSGTKIQSIKIPNLSIVSVRNDQEGANFRGSVISNNVDVNKKGDRSVILDSSFTADNKENKYMYGIVSNKDLSASVWSNSDASKFNRISTTSYKVGESDAFGMGSSEWVYADAELQVPEEDGNQPRPSLKVVITDDANGDGVINWNDGAIAYRDIMAEIKGSEGVPDQVAQRIVMNFGSMAPNPFLKSLDNVKRVYLATDGLGQKVLLKGYQSEGHDSAHPDYDDVGRRIGGVEDMKTLLDIGQEYGAVFGIHINAVETYPEAKAFKDELLTGSYGWNWIDAGFTIDTKYDWATGGRISRLRALKDLGLNLNFLYTDAWGNGGYGGDNWAARRHAEEIKSVGYAVATEWADKMEDDAIWSHWATDLNYGGFDAKGINSEVARFIHNHQKDVWIATHPKYAGVALNPLLGGYQLEGFEGWQANTDFANYIKVLFNTNLPTKFLQHFLINYWEDDSDNILEAREKEIRLVSAETKEDGTPLHNVVVKRAGNTGAEGLDASRVIELDGVKILEDNYKVDSVNNNGSYLQKGNYTEDVKYLIPWTWENIDGNTTDYEPKLYHWNLKGGSSTWTLPQEFQGGVKVYKLTDTGRVEVNNIVKDTPGSQITLDAEAATPYILVKSNSARTPKTITYGEKMHIVDPGFTAANLNVWNPTGSAELFRDYASNPMVKFTQPGDSVSQTITDLETNQKYTALVYVENQSDASNAVMEIQNGDEIKSVYTEKSINLNYVKADAHVQNSAAENSRMQTMQVTFVAKGDTATLTLKQELKEGKEADGLPSYFDDIRITKSASDYYPENLQVDAKYPVFYQDFENVERGIYPFVPNAGELVEDNRVHLAEKHASYTQRGWNGGEHNFIPYMIDDVIEGDWSLKTHAQLDQNKLLYNTIPQNFRFEPGVTYKIEFDYECGSDGEYKFMYGSGEYNPATRYSSEWIENTSSKPKYQHFEKLITGANDGQTWFGIYGQLNNTEDFSNKHVASGMYDFIMDNLKITKTNEPPVDYEPDDPYKEVAEIKSITAIDADGQTVPDEIPANENGNGPINLAFDKSDGTYWHSSWSTGYSVKYPTEIVIDLGENKNINKFEYLPRSGAGNGTITNADFSYMKDGDANYTKVARNMVWEVNGSAKAVDGISKGIAARYLKLTVNASVSDNDSQNFISAAEFLPYLMQGEPEPDDTDKNAIKIWDINATNKDGDTVIDNEPITNAIDQDLNTMWHSTWDDSNNVKDKLPVEIVMDMGETYKVAKFDYVTRPSGPNGSIGEVMLSYSTNKQNWTETPRKTFDRQNGTKTFDFETPIDARYIKLTVYSTYGNVESEVNAFVTASEFIPYKAPSKNEVLDDAVKDAQKVINDNGAKVDDVIKSIKDLSDAIVNYSKAEKSNKQ